MRDAFWSTLHDLNFKKLYLEKYHSHATRIDAVISAVAALASAGSISAWTIWQKLPLIWGIILMIVQVLQIVRPFLPYSRRLAALKYFIPEIRHLVLDVETEWYRAELSDSPDYITVLHTFRKRYISLECEYLGSDPLPDIKHLRSAAEKDALNHLRLFFGASEGDESDAEAST
ncbi:MAG: hypothetical protein J6S60_09190 [Oscillospiraceae bacterium]|nr:hypothetical protein [Oscillospiraceae bacterium]